MTVRGLVELQCGWWVAVGVYKPPEGSAWADKTARSQISLVVQFDPEGRTSIHGIKALVMTRDEAQDVKRLLEEAIERA